MNVSFGPIDQLNPRCGYSLTIERDGELLLDHGTSVDPQTGKDLLTAEDCLRVISYYLSEDAGR